MPALADKLCLRCGLCCNGTLFADVRRERGESSPLFAQHGPRVPQPCPAFDSATCKCAVYAGRPARCRKFECRQFIAVSNGDRTMTAALKTIRNAQALVHRMESILTRLGFNDTTIPLKRRFDRCQSAGERGQLARKELGHLADLQSAMHELNLLIASDFCS